MTRSFAGRIFPLTFSAKRVDDYHSALQAKLEADYEKARESKETESDG